MIAAIAGATALANLGRPEAGARRFLRWALAHRDGSTGGSPPATRAQ